MNGIICVYKPVGFTSFDVVAVMRGLLKTKKVGHSGTLDPIAEGVLPIFAGAATKAIDLAPVLDKEYRAGFKLGIATDTQDITGQVLATKQSSVSLAELNRVVQNYVGEIEQIPPMYSAVKVGGKRLYSLARKGIEVPRPSRKVTVYSAEVEEFDSATQEGVIKVACSKGTYIRTLIHDMGGELGTGGVMTRLQRTRSNGFALEDCYTIEQLRASDNIEALLKPIECLFDEPHMHKVHLDEEQLRAFSNGAELNLQLNGLYTLHDRHNRIIALADGDTIIRRFSYTNGG